MILISLFGHALMMAKFQVKESLKTLTMVGQISLGVNMCGMLSYLHVDLFSFGKFSTNVSLPMKTLKREEFSWPTDVISAEKKRKV